MSDVAVIIVAAGKSTRFNDSNYKKPFVPVNSRALWLHSVDRFIRRDDVKQLILVIAAEDEQTFGTNFGAEAAILGIDVVHGGETRAESVLNGLRSVREELEYVAVHDAARPCLTDRWLSALFDQAKQTGAAILGTPVVSTVKRVTESNITETVSREGLWESQTPQMFKKSVLQHAYDTTENYAKATDEAQLVEWSGHPVHMVEASPFNRKVTTQNDLQFIELALQILPKLDGPVEQRLHEKQSSHPLEDGDFWK